MKIAVIYMGIFPEIKWATGGGRRVKDLAKGLQLAGNETTIIVPIWNKPDSILIENNEINVVYLGRLKDGVVWSRMVFWYQAIKFTKLQKIDAILFYNTLIDSILPATILKLSKKFVIAEFCDLMSSQISNNGSQLFKKWIYQIHEYLLPKCTNLNIVISDYLYERINNFAPNTPIIKIPILVDFETFSQVNPQKNKTDSIKTIAYIGSFFHHEGVSFLVKAFARIIKKYPDYQLVIAGKHLGLPDNEDIELLSQQLGI
jgi:glycosyltransferase involved in cell wall biosynthesis